MAERFGQVEKMEEKSNNPLPTDKFIFSLSKLEIDAEPCPETSLGVQQAYLPRKICENGSQVDEGKVAASEQPSVEVLKKEVKLKNPDGKAKSFPSLSVTPPFILKLCSMLVTNEFIELVTWGSQNDTVLVKDLKGFSQEVLPKYFKHKNFTSFLRQLNMYGFYTLRQGDNWREFKNELFKKDSANDYDKIKRKTAQNPSSAQLSKPAKLNKLSSLASGAKIPTKENRKRKKDVFKGRAPPNLLKSEIIEQQRDVMMQLLTRCEANEERIETLEEEMRSMKRIILQLRQDISEDQSNTIQHSNSVSTSSSGSSGNYIQGPQNTKSVPQSGLGTRHLNDDPGFVFDPGCLSDAGHDYLHNFDGLHMPFPSALPEQRPRRLSDSLISVLSNSNVNTFGNASQSLHQPPRQHQLPSVEAPETHAHSLDSSYGNNPLMSRVNTPNRGMLQRKTSFDEMSLSMYSHNKHFSFGTVEGPRLLKPKKKKSSKTKQKKTFSTATYSNSQTSSRSQPVQKESDKVKRKKKISKVTDPRL